MSEFLNRVMGLLETFAGPVDWRRECINGVITFSGRYAVCDPRGIVKLSIHGRIVQRGRRETEVYIYDPPAFVGKHRHGCCMQLLHPNDRWFKLHFESPAGDFVEAYTYVEHLLNEAYNQTRMK